MKLTQVVMAESRRVIGIWNSKFNPFFVVVVVFGTFNSNQSNYVFVSLCLIFPNLGYSKLCFWYIHFTTM